MFNKEEKNKKKIQADSEINIISENTKFTGDIISKGDFRIDGLIEGNLKTTGKLIISKVGLVKGTLECSDADIYGEFIGDLTVSNFLAIKKSANISGDVITGGLSVDPGAIMKATCSMKSTVKEKK